MNLESILKQKNIKLSDKIKYNKNGLEIDLNFISKAYNTKTPIDFIYKHNFSNIFMHPKQLMNLFNNITINNSIIYDKTNLQLGSNYTLSDFIKYINKLTINDIINLTIKEEINLLKQTELLLLVYIGNINIGNILIEKIKKYKLIQDFAVVFIINNKINISPKDFDNYAIYKCNEFGNDIVPTLLVYNQLRLGINMNFEYIIKLHTKGNNYFNRATDYLLDKPLNELLKKQTNGRISNTISLCYKNIKTDKFNLNLYKKYKNLINKEYFSVATIFLIHKEPFLKVLNFLLDNYKYCVFNNMYDDNSVNRNESYIHFIERLFGLI